MMLQDYDDFAGYGARPRLAEWTASGWQEDDEDPLALAKGLMWGLVFSALILLACGAAVTAARSIF